MKGLLLSLLLLLLVAGCGGGGGDPVSVSVGTLALSSSVSSAGTNSEVKSNASYIDSNVDAYSSWAKVDGLKLKLISISLVKDDGSYVNVIDFSPYEEIVLTNSSTNSIAFSGTGSIEAGTYVNSSVSFYDEYDLKAVAYVDGSSYYTTASGIESISGDYRNNTSALSGYDYYHYDFMYVTTSEGPAVTTDMSNEGNQFFDPVTVADGEASNIQFLVDIYRLVNFWNGGGSISNMQAPFNWTNNNGLSNTDFFPAGKENFGVSYIPMFVSINDAGTTTGEIYVMSTSSGDIANFTGNESSISYVTMAFKSTGEFVGARITGFDEISSWTSL